jgi:hypothetical protein
MLPEDEKKSILKVVAALIRDYNAKQASLLTKEQNPAQWPGLLSYS